MRTLILRIRGLSCEACAKLVKKRIEKVPGIFEVTVDVDGLTSIVAKRPIEINEIKYSLLGTDYSVE